MKTLYQLQNAALAVENGEENTSLAEIFSIELKFTVDCLKFWFERNRKVLEISEHQRIQFTKNNVKTTCCIYDFPIQSRADKGWFEHVCKAEYMLLENVFGSKDLYQMKIPNFETYFDKVKKILDNVNDFCTSIESENRISIVKEQPNPKLDEIINKIKKIKITKVDKNDKEAPKQKAIGFLYLESIKFLPNDKISSDFPMSDNFLQNLFFVHNNQVTIHHSHVTGKIIGFAHKYCNLQIRENYYTIPVIAHKQFRFDFFLFLKGLRPSVWETTDINIGRKNPTDVNYAII